MSRLKDLFTQIRERQTHGLCCFWHKASCRHARNGIYFKADEVAFCVNHFIIANSEVPTSSMETTIMAGDRVIGSRLSYKFGDPQRGDIAIFIYPDDEAKGIKTYYVKRIIGMPGDTIDIVDGKVYLNGSDTPVSYTHLTLPTIA